MNKPEWNGMNVRLYSVLFSYHSYLLFGQIYRFMELILSVLIKKHKFRIDTNKCNNFFISNPFVLTTVDCTLLSFFTLTASDFSSYSMYHQKTLDLKINLNNNG